MGLLAIGLGTAATAQTSGPVAELAPVAPDYADTRAWAAGPGGSGASAALPEGASPHGRSPRVDVFYVHPTAVRSERLLNQDLSDNDANRWVDESLIARQASAFGACCRIFAPRYRSATYKALSSGFREEAFALAYGDVERAFDWYLEHENRGRPFILAGHSQGAHHLATLLERRVDGSPLRRRLVAAYIIGNNLAEGDFGHRFRNVGACARPDETGCAVQWNAVLSRADLNRAASAAERAYVARHGDDGGKTTLCVNPLTFDRRPAAPASKARGAVPGSPGFGAPRPLRPRAVTARCERGMLIVQPDPALDLQPMADGSMHYHDIGLFYGDIRANTLARVRAYLRHHGSRQAPRLSPTVR